MCAFPFPSEGIVAHASSKNELIIIGALVDRVTLQSICCMHMLEFVQSSGNLVKNIDELKKVG